MWSVTATYFVLEKFGNGETAYVAPRLEPVQDAPIIHEWYLAAKNRLTRKMRLKNRKVCGMNDKLASSEHPCPGYGEQV